MNRNGVLSDVSEPVSKVEKYCDDQNLSCFFCGSEFATGGLLTRHISDHTGEKLLTCVVCKKTFSLESELVIHVCGGESSQHHQSQTEEPIPASKQFSCSQCEEGFSRSEDLNLHLKLHTRESLFRCSVCKACCSDKDSLIQHMRIHTRQTRFICHVCEKDFTWRRHLTKHMEVHKKRKKVFRCRACGAEFCTYYLLSKHKAVHRLSESPHIQTEENREEQEQMETAADGEDFGRPENLNTDPQTQQETNVEALLSLKNKEDEFWKQTRETESNLPSVRHNEVSQSDTKTDLQPFTLKEDLSQHTVFDPEIQKEVKQEDPEPPQIKEEEEEAEITNLTFSPVPLKTEEDEKPQLSQLHHSQTEQSNEFLGEPEENEKTSALSDPEIDDSDLWKPKLESGSNSESDSGRNLSSCSDNKVTESLQPESDDSVDSDFFKDYKKPQSNLNSLRQETTEKGAKYISDLKPYSCAQCSKAFRFSVYLKSHMKQHTNRYICSVCGHRSHNKSNLKVHLRTHTGEKPFGCSVCSKTFTNKASMLSHMTVHDTEKKYSCDECKKTFAWFTELKYHQCVSESSGERTYGDDSGINLKRHILYNVTK
ncbi:zinc finger protein 184 [Austrofundulus limnaeus]|uniref:Zinc finger protein 184-like n=1 Tax=Austrofundulus limnaeus TaxID=52670 RepID=A0A2I4BH45_AUSLI|nr:PREDICTED: zinc finger protein 184-like [Austrofundulus limnaeus]XP_013867065.1 PREDICTED: zinc finger protein 184-like [Austrofundulus limnaeus]XP_013867066.1 PREDICTED: zinc finger protein 184-like [Austrofundulus limnaeus]